MAKMINRLRRRNSQNANEKEAREEELDPHTPGNTSKGPSQSFFPFRRRSKTREVDLADSTPAPHLSISIVHPSPIVGPTDISMTATPPYSQVAPPLSLLVILPAASGHSAQLALPSRSASRPAPLLSRQSGSSVTTLQSLQESSAKKVKAAENGDAGENMAMAPGRRMSLATGLGAGTQASTSPTLPRITSAQSSNMSEPRLTNPWTPPPAVAPRFGESSRGNGGLASSGVPTFGSGSKRGFGLASGRQPPSRRRPVTAAGEGSAIPLVPQPGGGVNRGSVGMPSGMGLGMSVGVAGGMSRNRPGWEGDEVVGILRGSGLEVTVIRHVSHLGPIISPSSDSLPSFAQTTLAPRSPRSFLPSSASSYSTVTHVILVPLSDSPTLPSLSLLLAQGTTPTAVCFQQDLLERARRTEEEWLPSAIEQIRNVADMRDRAYVSNSKGLHPNAIVPERAIILAYSANPALSSSTTAACVEAGASGVLKPPFDLDTARLVRRMVRAAREGRISSLVQLPTELEAVMPRKMSLQDEAQVILPPTALAMGGELEGEKILNAAVHGRKLSEPRSSISTGPGRKGSLSSAMLPPPHTSVSWKSAATPSTGSLFPPDYESLRSFSVDINQYRPGLEIRRRSVDVGGLTVAMKRVQQRLDIGPPQDRRGSQDDFAAPYATSTNGRKSKVNKNLDLDDDLAELDTRVAELLSAMYYHTRLTINAAMAEYENFSAPVSPEHRASLIDALSTWDFKPHHMEEVDLYRVACLIFEGVLSIEGVAELDMSQDQVNRFLFATKAIYHAPNPYHNYVHAIDVLQATYTFLMNLGVVPPFSYLRDANRMRPWARPEEEDAPVGGLGTRRAREVMRPQDVLAIVVSAMGHDVGHPGLSNAFMKNAKTPLSQVYDDKSVLENMHCMLLVQLLKKHSFGFLVGRVTAADEPPNPARQAFDARGFRHVLYSSVLATDMSLHFAWVSSLKALGDRLAEWDDEGPVCLSRANKKVLQADRILICQALIKCADISNPTRPISVSEHWSSVLLEEWAKQASLEQDLDLPVSVVASADAALQAKGQIGFIDLFTQPLFEAVCDVLPELSVYAQRCADNRALWRTRLDEMDDAGTEVIQPAIEGESQDERFRSLFPLSLPPALVSSHSLEVGPLGPSEPITPPARFSSLLAKADNDPKPVLPTANAQLTASPVAASLPKTTSNVSLRAMRVVYRDNLLNQRSRLSSWAKSAGADLDEGSARRMSTPDGLIHKASLAR